MYRLCNTQSVSRKNQNLQMLHHLRTVGKQTWLFGELKGYLVQPVHVDGEAVFFTLGLPSVSSNRRRGILGSTSLVKIPDLTPFSTR